MKGESRIDHIEDLYNIIAGIVEKHDDMIKVVEIGLRLLWLIEFILLHVNLTSTYLLIKFYY